VHNNNWHSRPVKDDELKPTTSDRFVFGVVIGAWIVVGVLFVFEVI